MENYLKTKEKELKLTTLGFTLIELLAVIIIISIIAVIMFPPIIEKIEKNKEKAYFIEVNIIEEAAKKYILENNVNDKYHLNTLCVKLSDLQNKGYLEKGNIINPKTDKNFDLERNYIKIKYDLEKNQYEYNFTDICTPNLVKPASEMIISNNNIKITGDEEGLYETIDSYIFKGKNPNNYIQFNNNIWRIVSINKETMLIKIINLNDNQKQVTTNGFIKDLNDDFENGTTYSAVKEYINLNSRWESGVVSELDSAVSLKSLEKQKTIYNTISLLTVGEYVDASLVKNCHKTNNCDSYLSISKNYWLLNQDNNNNWYVNDNNKLNKGELKEQLYNVYPCLYLKLDTQIEGEGTSSNPYKIK